METRTCLGRPPMSLPPGGAWPREKPARFTAIGYEVLWTRALEQFTHNSTYAYTAMLATFLIGIGVGSAVASGPADRVKRPSVPFGALQLGVGISVACALLTYMRLLHWIPAVTEAGTFP